jgi:hypothetical protein
MEHTLSPSGVNRNDEPATAHRCRLIFAADQSEAAQIEAGVETKQMRVACRCISMHLVFLQMHFYASAIASAAIAALDTIIARQIYRLLRGGSVAERWTCPS